MRPNVVLAVLGIAALATGCATIPDDSRSGNLVSAPTGAVSGDGAEAAANLQSRVGCSPSDPGQPVVELSWEPARSRGDEQRVEVTLNPGGFGEDNWTSPKLSGDVSELSWNEHVDPGLVHRWRVLTLQSDGWIASETASFDGPVCIADQANDGGRSAPPSSPAASPQPTERATDNGPASTPTDRPRPSPSPSQVAPLDPMLDVGGDRAATRLSVTEAGCALDVPRDVVVTFAWSPAQVPGLEQRVQITVYRDGFATGRYSLSESLGSGASRFTWQGAAEPGLVNHWRVVTRHDTGWAPSESASLEAPVCIGDEAG